MSDTEDEIEQILNEITIKELRTLKDIKRSNKDIISTIYKDYLKYPVNKENKTNISNFFLKNNYEYVDIKDNFSSGWICYIDLTKFYNLKIHCRGLFIKFKSDNSIILKLNKRYYTVNINNKIFFRKLTNKDILKIHLIDTINK